MTRSPRTRLFVMMVLQFFVWGAWLPPVFDIMPGLGFSANEQALIGSCFAIASIVGIFFSNQFADRSFAAERFLAGSHLIGGLALVGLYFTTTFWPFFALMLVHSLVYVPTISVTNSLAFAHLRDPQKEFGLVRMGGTIGWILAAWPLYFVLKDIAPAEALAAKRTMFLIAGAAALGLSAFSLFLPHTPPKPAVTAGDRLAFLKAAALLKKPFVLVLFLVTFVDATIHNGYFVMAFTYLANRGFEPGQIMPVMSIGQVAEILTMAVLGMVLKSLGWRVTMTLGVLGHAARFLVFAFSLDHTAIMAVQVLHGVCYAFFFATVYIFIDAYFPSDVRTSAQGLFNLLILGLGDLAAKWLFLPLQEHYTSEVPKPLGAAGELTKVVDYQSLFLWPSGMALAAAVVLALCFHPPQQAAGRVGAPQH
ncbi:MAG: MFS transporter [Planctomycetes bacterium]|nr:MFS transporter [Planctomycetota bacterium]